MDPKQLAAYAEVSERTAQRYISHPDLIPAPIMALLQIRALGLIPDDQFADWCVFEGKLVHPTAAKHQHLTPEQIQALGHAIGHARWMDRHAAKLEARIRELEDRLASHDENQAALQIVPGPRNTAI